MSPYVTPIKFALFAFPILAALIAVPILLYEYHKFGSFNKAKGFVFYTFIFYLLCAYFLVILPLPEIDSVTSTYREMIQPIPFRFIADFFKETVFVLSKPGTYIPALLQGVVLQPVFNLVMVIPFGIYMRYFFKKSFKQTLLLSFGLSLFFEITQLSGLYGIYPGPYRLFDVDDLLINTLGGVIGYGIAPYLTSFFPTRDDFDYSARSHSQYVSLTRRLLCFFVDHTLVVGISNLFKMVSGIDNIVIYFVFYILYFVVFAYLRGGRTLGQSFLHLKTAGSDGHKVGLGNLMIRSLLIFLTIDQPSFFTNALGSALPGIGDGDGLHSLIYVLILMVVFGFLFMHFCYVIFSRKNLFFYESLSNTHIENTAQHN